MSLCDLNCCDLKWLQTKFDAINKKISDNQKIQDKINANIFKLLKENGIDIETLLKNYYALNEEDYTKTLTSEDDINTLEPGTYKIVKTDMPQNAPKGVANSEYDGTLIISNSYAILIEYGFLHIGNLLTDINKFMWNYVINSNLINIHLQYYMLISKYSDGEYIDDIHILNQNFTGVFIVNSTTQNLPVQENGIIIVRLGTATNSLFVTFIPEDSFDVYHCTKKADGSWSEWGQVAFISDVPSLTGYATQEWVQEYNKDNYLPLIYSLYNTTTYDNLASYPLGISIADSEELGNVVSNEIGPNKECLLLKTNSVTESTYVYLIFDYNDNAFYWVDSLRQRIRKFIFNTDLNSYATQDWVEQQIQDITGGSVTADWVKSNFYPLTLSQYNVIPENANYAELMAGCYYGYAGNFTDDKISSLQGEIVLIKFEVYRARYYRAIIYNITSNRIYFYDGNTKEMLQIAYSKDIPNLSGYATQAWVQSQNYLTEIPDEYTTVTEVGQAITAALVGYATQAWVSEQIQEITGGAVTSDIVSQMISDALNGYATQTWVNGRGYQNAAQVSAAITAAIAGYATESYTKENFLSLNNDSYILIEHNDDLNNYQTKGSYYALDRNTTSTLTNLPKGLIYGFKLTVEDLTSNDYLCQKITENLTGNTFIRTFEGQFGWHDWNRIAHMKDLPNLSNYATQEWIQQQGYQTVQQVNSLINTATADMLTQEDLDTFNYATENWVLQTALEGYATEAWVESQGFLKSVPSTYATKNWVTTELNDYLPKQQAMSLTTQGTFYGLQYQWARYGQMVEVFLIGNLTQTITNQLISSFCPANPMRTLQCVIPGYDNTDHYAEFNNNGLKLMGTYNNELYVNCHFTYLTND